MRRLIVITAGVLLAFMGGCCFLVTALLLESLATPSETSLALFRVAALVAATAQNGEAAHLVETGLGAIWLALLAVCLAPVGLVALLGEVAGMRTLVYAAGATGTVTAAVPTMLREASEASVRPAAGEGRATLILFLTGLCSGFAYWAVAGRSVPRMGRLR